ncbi:MAG: tryptophan 7-halogenase [Bryobacteraceae bacterium]|jgi:flavin-dependent dehydrogenase
MGPTAVRNFDVTVIGGGLAGMAASLHLAKAGFRVACIEPETGLRQPVGESLDWASPALLSALGLPPEDLIEFGIATYKRGVTLQLRTGEVQNFRPPAWVAQAPFSIVLHTIHVDRMRLDRSLQDLAVARGVTIVHDKALTVEKRGMRIVSIQTASGAQFESPWFIDASGSFTSFLAREFNLPAVAYGPRKVCLWSYFTAPQAHEGTTIYMDPVRGDYQDWAWEIPIGPNTLSVGYVTTGTAVKKWRDLGLSVEDILRLERARFPRLASLSQKDSDTVPRVTSFTCRTYRGIAGPNWIIAGEAASMVDPITSNGVTSALRHAAEASALIAASRGKSELPYLARKSYSMRVLQLGRFFNSGIERLVYDWPVRDRLGIARAATIYTDAAWSVNGLYSRFQPQSVLSTVIFGALLNVLRAGAWVLYRSCGFRPSKRPT